MLDPTKTGLIGSDEVEKIDPAHERALAGQGGPLPPEWMFDSASNPPEPSDDTAPSPDPDVQGLVDAVVESELVAENSQGHTVNHKPIHKTMAVVLGLGSLTCVGALLLFGLTTRRSPTVAEVPEEDEVEELVFQDDSARLRSQLALQGQQTAMAELEAQETNLVVDEDPEAEAIAEPASPPARPVSSSPPPRPAPTPRPDTPSPPRPVSTPAGAPAAPEPTPVDPFERWAQLAQLGTERAGEEHIEGAMVAARADVFAQAAAGGQDPSSPFQRVSMGETHSQAQRLAGTQPQTSPRPSVQPALAQPGFQAAIRPQLQAARPPSGESVLVASTPGTQGILDWHRQRQLSPPSPVQPTLGTQVEATIVAPMAWDLASGADQSLDLGAGRFVIELDQDLTDPRGRVGLPQGTNLIAQANTVSPDNQLVQASVIAVVYPSDGQIVQQAIPAGALLVQGEGAQPLVAQRLNDLGPNLAAEDLLVGTLSALGQAGAVLNQPREEFRSAAAGDSTNSTVTRTTRDPNLVGGILEGFGSTISDRIQRRSEQNTQANIEANTVAVLPEGMAVTVIVNSFLEITP